jgi:hypothetical protein
MVESGSGHNNVHPKQLSFLQELSFSYTSATRLVELWTTHTNFFHTVYASRDVHWRSIVYTSITYRTLVLVGDIIWLQTYQTQSVNQYSRSLANPRPTVTQTIKSRLVVNQSWRGRPANAERSSVQPGTFLRKQQCASECKTWTLDRMSCRAAPFLSLSFSIILWSIPSFQCRVRTHVCTQILSGNNFTDGYSLWSQTSAESTRPAPPPTSLSTECINECRPCYNRICSNVAICNLPLFVANFSRRFK